MNGEILAEVHRVLRGDSERALVHAVDDDGHEYRIELPERALREVEDGRGYALRLSWSLESGSSVSDDQAATPSPGPHREASPPAQAASSGPERRSPAEVDAAFMALMKGLDARRVAAPADPVTTSAPPSSSTAEATASSAPRAAPDSAMQLASRLGLTAEPATGPQAIE